MLFPIKIRYSDLNILVIHICHMLRNVFVKTLFKQREVKMRRCVKSLGVDYY